MAYTFTVTITRGKFTNFAKTYTRDAAAKRSLLQQIGSLAILGATFTTTIGGACEACYMVDYHNGATGRAMIVSAKA